ncbi:WecB/TagA/CpsF family glycosyltransferase [Paenibacillus cremeus]|uniref:N-acetylglucosaminyldiphosphoundecaprenol N-acetyl-beta-D-mannosaminyltransferase n=1 Tax=Paenibacillus cremeus TaxID=2163881 RepID=A0A559KI37_9BACL|nr:WecB/TagA/CpsF family glycosyltransferase [Paenibacillus cremeus]TVY11786.1 WecB/TagA/CpsF family glycosyltransferase [Paenibacillus cremeus]
MDNYSNIMGIPVPQLTMRNSVELINKVIEQKPPELFHVVTLNPEIAMACQQDQQLRSILDGAGLLTADGIGIVMVSRLKGNPLPERVTGCDLLLHLLEAGNQKKWSFYFLGADEATSEKASKVIRRTYPNVSVLGRHHGYFYPMEEAQIVEEIGSLQPDVLVVALGAPFAERWIYKHKDQLHARIAIGVGGSLDVIAGKVKRAPELWRKLGVEWLYRLLHQPSRWRRQLILPRFALRALFYKER